MKRKKNSGSILMHVVLLALILIALILLAILIVHRIQLKNPAPAESAQPAETVLPSASPEPSETPAPTPTPTPEPDAAERLLAGMTTREKLCQLLVVQPEYLLTSYANVTRMTDGLRQGLRDYPVGGVLLTLPNMNGADQLTALTASLQESSSIPLILCLDEEGGEVSRLMQKVGTTKLDNMYTYRSKGAETARANGATLGRDLKRFGFNTDLAPVADVWSNPANKVIGERAYSDDFDEAAVLVSAAVQGFHDSDTICCLKHFPGHGSTRTDSHEEAAYVDGSSTWYTLWRVMLPNAKPALITVFLFSLVWYWNDTTLSTLYYDQFQTVSTELLTIGDSIRQFVQVTTYSDIVTWVQCGVFLSLTPLILLYVFFQRHFVESIVTTGLVG